MNLFEIILVSTVVLIIDAKRFDLNNNGYYWRDWNLNDSVPEDAVYGGFDKEGGKTFIVKTVYSKDGLDFGNTETISHGELLILASHSQHRLKWVPTKSGDDMNKVLRIGVMIRGGFDKSKPVVIGRKAYGAEIIVGNVIVDPISNKVSVLTLTKAGKVVVEKNNFEILVYDAKSEDCQKVHIILPDTNH